MRISNFTISVMNSTTISITAIFKTTQPPNTTFTTCCLQWTAANQTESLYFECFNQQNCLLDQIFSIIYQKWNLRCDWIDIEHIQVELLFDGSLLQMISCEFFLCRPRKFENVGKIIYCGFEKRNNWRIWSERVWLWRRWCILMRIIIISTTMHTTQCYYQLVYLQNF